MEARISVIAYCFLAFLDLTCHLEVQAQVLSSCTVPPNSKEPKFRSSNQEASPSTDKNTRVVLVQWHTWEGAPTDISDGVDIPRSLSVICYNRWVLNEGHKN